MTPQYILRASLCRDPHCFSAVPVRQYRQEAESEIENMRWAEGYAEPGYDDPVYGILFANWNIFCDYVTIILERAGYSLEWSDEWSICEDCHRAVRTSPDSHDWEPSYRVIDDEIICRACLSLTGEKRTHE